ncbi:MULTISPECIES: 50S ribosomal protein L25/general stress protein Ctc [Microcella]|uniref:50S ribosomal protein L25/general stress protein Ctc n=1 Tax=Microcella TaxID=337004 RepID=UPI0015CF5772|nr:MULTISPECIES: 50S ribosomal protein L25/general stress protein Ctc [Microcella]MBU1250423.1 50S ribosomal protein L25/general stress protein Ctc [Actinomycetota bacterium]MBU1610099.1 50S ribosomal protein L25/general stress protein Ctc [Actinomycetota bacterium]MBU2315533.1 50S ribosomal protein L25/general stress protein Ctc [Actinomycetota bacterium]MBU2385334.1 50S ribosomal protein L25/general stress protein Ctc [Actinomycetota bacterium]QOD94168.1 50S ribosomal protein L25/general str
MADQNKLIAEDRTAFGKGAARKLRATHKIPAVVYGHGTEPRHIALPGHETALLLRKSNVIVTLDIEGEKLLALVKDVQKDPVRQLIEHIDMIVVRKGEKVTVDVYVHLEGESAPGTIAMVDHNTLTVEAEATHIPESFTVSIEGLEEGAQIHASDVELPSGTTLITDPEALVVNITVPRATVAEGDEAAEGEAAEGETAEDASAEAGDSESDD